MLPPGSDVRMIILVDDDPDQRLVLRLALEQAGYTVREAANGSEALVLQREHSSKFLITDIFMPEADGFEVIDSFLREFPQTKIIVVSGGGQAVEGQLSRTRKNDRRCRDIPEAVPCRSTDR
jgi:CheY-like chemotaxis protein